MFKCLFKCFNSCQPVSDLFQNNISMLFNLTSFFFSEYILCWFFRSKHQWKKFPGELWLGDLKWIFYINIINIYHVIFCLFVVVVVNSSINISGLFTKVWYVDDFKTIRSLSFSFKYTQTHTDTHTFFLELITLILFVTQWLSISDLII